MKMSQIFKTSQQPRCCHNTKNGGDCKATPQTGKQYCFFHDPATREKRAQARRAGAAIRNQTMKLLPNFPIHSLQSAGAVVNLLDRIINHVLQGEMDMRSATGIGYLCAIQLSGIHKRDLEKRQAPLEAAVTGLSLLKNLHFDEDSDVESDEIEEVEQHNDVSMIGGSASQPASTPDGRDSSRQKDVSPESIENAKHESAVSVKARPLLENNSKTDGHSELPRSRRCQARSIRFAYSRPPASSYQRCKHDSDSGKAEAEKTTIKPGLLTAALIMPLIAKHSRMRG
jgi:hypothetical protein